MIDVIKLVFGAVATKDIVPVLTHFCVYADLLDSRGRIQGSNGVVYIDAPFEHSIVQCAVPAQRFKRAVEACDGEPQFGVTPAGRLSVKRGRFKAYIPVLNCEDYPRAALVGEQRQIPPTFLQAIATLKPFVSADASRPWSQSILLRQGYMYATNNVILARLPIIWPYDSLVLPLALIERIVDIAQTPDSIYVDRDAVSLTYGDAWLRSALLQLDWAAVERYIQEPATEEVPADLLSAVTKIKDLGENEQFPVINLGPTVSTDGEEAGASFEGFDLPEAKFHAEQLLKVLEVATHVNFSSYPAPCAWRGNSLEGIFVGLKTA